MKVWSVITPELFLYYKCFLTTGSLLCFCKTKNNILRRLSHSSSNYTIIPNRWNLKISQMLIWKYHFYHPKIFLSWWNFVKLFDKGKWKEGRKKREWIRKRNPGLQFARVFSYLISLYIILFYYNNSVACLFSFSINIHFFSQTTVPPHSSPPVPLLQSLSYTSPCLHHLLLLHLYLEEGRPPMDVNHTWPIELKIEQGCPVWG